MHSCCKHCALLFACSNFTSCHGCLLLCLFPQCFAVSRRTFCNFLCACQDFFTFLMSNFKKNDRFLLLPDLQVKVWCKFGENFTQTCTPDRFTGNFHQTFIKLSLHKWKFIASLMQVLFTTASLLKVSMHEWKFAWNFHSWSARFNKNLHSIFTTKPFCQQKNIQNIQDQTNIMQNMQDKQPKKAPNSIWWCNISCRHTARINLYSINALEKITMQSNDISGEQPSATTRQKNTWKHDTISFSVVPRCQCHPNAQLQQWKRILSGPHRKGQLST